MKNNLKVCRTKQNITQKQMAELCNISERQYIRYENSQQLPSVTIAIKMADVLKTRVEDLFMLEDSDRTT